VRLYVDENVPAEIVEELREHHDVVYAGEPERKGRRDVWHLRRAADEGRVLITLDFNDFRHLHRIGTALRVLADIDIAHPGILTAVKDIETATWLRALSGLLSNTDAMAGRFLACHADGTWIEDSWRAS
jgi:hypothetical protein